MMIHSLLLLLFLLILLLLLLLLLPYKLSVQHTNIDESQGQVRTCHVLEPYSSQTPAAGWCADLMKRCCRSFSPSFTACPSSTLATCAQSYTSNGQTKSDRLIDYCSCSVGKSSIVNHRDFFFMAWWVLLSIFTTTVVCVMSWYRAERKGTPGQMRMLLLDKAHNLLSMGGARRRGQSQLHRSLTEVQIQRRREYEEEREGMAERAEQWHEQREQKAQGKGQEKQHEQGHEQGQGEGKGKGKEQNAGREGSIEVGCAQNAARSGGNRWGGEGLEWQEEGLLEWQQTRGHMRTGAVDVTSSRRAEGIDWDM
jgi:hypothetical protein